MKDPYFFQIAGAAMIACGVVVRFVLHVGYYNMGIALMVVGCCIIVMVVIGCCGVLTENRIMLSIVRLRSNHSTVRPTSAKEVMLSSAFLCLLAGLRINKMRSILSAILAHY